MVLIIGCFIDMPLSAGRHSDVMAQDEEAASGKSLGASQDR
jgi:hypothetical protein